MKLRALDVSEVNSYVKRILTNDAVLYNLKVKGEISNFKVHSSKNVYLTLKDKSSKINCVIFKNNYDSSLNLEDGMKVIATGYISVYERDGSYQLYIENVELDGLGNLYIEFLKLKEKLGKEGLFDYIHKKPIPKMPKNIGIITSETGAVIKDIINVVKRRYPKVNIKLYSVSVQGKNSCEQICEGIKFFNNANNVDTIILGRGGGSIEELWSFNEESVAREIFSSHIPIISAVGHETDFTIADFVADMRAPTPSAAAEIATPKLDDLLYKLKNSKDRLDKALINQSKLDKNKLNNVYDRLNTIVKSYIIRDKIIQIDIIYDKITNEINDVVKLKKGSLDSSGSLLHSLSPLATLDRGYSIVQKDKTTINTINSLKEKDSIAIKFKDGTADCIIEKIKD
ncbi:exodeoxyribonuclease VII, large subunit [[Clostridium] bifermentans ATCC 638]|uniref:Exodeoxyribonuclease 7 large subunit n=1 Tax=Paraclostridium bifermentans ATCC 638 = DSM 14991 TaxID=1233171 RepID=T4VSX2_PARBF|nr:exodeoxyribonuclease VII large subunit [Paraclostridium bifermentans]EQK43792.1 exodeoxyribonuclease VII, large subunit [[Clostridium] bifermentans ATCC 638] [Paraclostridium bifermentans ATCC 638 = DSM 14991]RIZ59511.1 exodeoxyribonuclease VII large subunit [Paraclostridium bifermentans]UAG17624.1 exodeoxyribonuclease VII large subunit [Paraclostridium bifermentans]